MKKQRLFGLAILLAASAAFMACRGSGSVKLDEDSFDTPANFWSAIQDKLTSPNVSGLDIQFTGQMASNRSQDGTSFIRLWGGEQNDAAEGYLPTDKPVVMSTAVPFANGIEVWDRPNVTFDGLKLSVTSSDARANLLGEIDSIYSSLLDFNSSIVIKNSTLETGTSANPANISNGTKGFSRGIHAFNAPATITDTAVSVYVTGRMSWGTCFYGFSGFFDRVTFKTNAVPMTLLFEREIPVNWRSSFTFGSGNTFEGMKNNLEEDAAKPVQWIMEIAVNFETDNPETPAVQGAVFGTASGGFNKLKPQYQDFLQTFISSLSAQNNETFVRIQLWDSADKIGEGYIFTKKDGAYDPEPYDWYPFDN